MTTVTKPVRAVIIIQVTCPECDEVLKEIPDADGKIAGQELNCDWCELNLKVPDIWLKTES